MKKLLLVATLVLAPLASGCQDAPAPGCEDLNDAMVSYMVRCGGRSEASARASGALYECSAVDVAVTADCVASWYDLSCEELGSRNFGAQPQCAGTTVSAK